EKREADLRQLQDRHAAEVARLRDENTALRADAERHGRALAEALEQQAATAEVLRVIASSPTDVQPVLDAIAENPARLCDASHAPVLRVAGDRFFPKSVYGPMPLHFPSEGLPINRGLVSGRAVVDRRTVHVHDLTAEPDTEFRESKGLQVLE